jgi:hypothetical protein
MEHDTPDPAHTDPEHAAFAADLYAKLNAPIVLPSDPEADDWCILAQQAAEDPNASAREQALAAAVLALRAQRDQLAQWRAWMERSLHLLRTLQPDPRD